MRQRIVRQMLMLTGIMLVCSGVLRAQATAVRLSDLAPITPDNAGQLEYLDTPGLYGAVGNFDWRDNHTLAIGSATGVRVYDVDHLDAPPERESLHYVPRGTLSPDGTRYY